jgi:hypothetical protein
MSALPQELRDNFEIKETKTMRFAQTHAEPRMTPAKAAIVAARILRAPRLDNPAFAGLEGAMTP